MPPWLWRRKGARGLRKSQGKKCAMLSTGTQTFFDLDGFLQQRELQKSLEAFMAY